MADMAEPDQLEMCWNDLEQMGIVGGASTVVPGHLHQLRRVDQSLLRRARRRRLHVVERGGDAEVGVGARRADSVPARSAPRPQHRLQDGRAARRDGACGIRTRSGAASSRTPSKRARIILWKGHCSVHTRFTVRQIENLRAQHPGIRVIVHPEVPWDVVQAADDSGSTEYIIKQVKESPAGSIWAVGTEIHLVNRLAQQVAARPHRALARSVRLPVLDDVPRVAEPPAVDARRAGRRRGPQPHRRARRPEALDEGRARPHAVDLVATRACTRPCLRTYDPTVYDRRRRQGGRPMAHTLPPLPYASDALEPHIDKHDDGDSSRQAPRRLRDQPERRAREASRAAVEERRGSAAAASTPCPRTSAPPSATTAAATPTTRCSGRSWARSAAARRPARSPTRSTSSFGSFDKFKEAVQEGRRRPLRQRLGLGDRQRRQARDREHAEPGQPADGRQEARSSASTSGSTPTT